MCEYLKYGIFCSP